jgi:hypothetical protein
VVPLYQCRIACMLGDVFSLKALHIWWHCCSAAHHLAGGTPSCNQTLTYNRDTVKFSGCVRLHARALHVRVLWVYVFCYGCMCRQCT